MPYCPGTNSGHGYVWARPDGMRARCGGPNICKECLEDYVAKKRADRIRQEIEAQREIKADQALTAKLEIDKEIAVPLLLSRNRAYALAQMCKRFTFEHATMLADMHDGGQQRDDILGAISNLEKILALSLGFKVR